MTGLCNNNKMFVPLHLFTDSTSSIKSKCGALMTRWDATAVVRWVATSENASMSSCDYFSLREENSTAIDAANATKKL